MAITGTNGKTTTSLLGEILKEGRTTHVVGNIGVPLRESRRDWSRGYSGG